MPMVFGNLNDESGTGVAFTRDPATGEKKLMGEFLKNAQGEDVVAGVRTPMPIAQMEKSSLKHSRNSLRYVIHLRITTEICRIWSSLLRTESSICFRP
jgi:phosphoenolpyruvate synthase/pyruvate phosphate dikinase